MAPVGQYVFAEMLVISEYFAAGSHEWLPYSVIPAFSKQIGKHQFVALSICLLTLLGENYVNLSVKKRPGDAAL